MTDEQIRQEMQAADEIRSQMAERSEAREASSEQYYQWMSDRALNSPTFGRDVEEYLPEHTAPAIGVEPNQADMTPIYGTLEHDYGTNPEPESGQGMGY